MSGAQRVLLAGLLGALASCDRPDASPPAEASPAADSTDIATLVTTANRQLHHGEGQACLDTLARLRAQAPKLMDSMVPIHAQCEMLAGRCQAGKRALAAYYERETAMAPEQAERTTEAIASMRCRGDDLTERDRLLRALWEITDGAYQRKRDDCDKNIALVRELGPKVTPKDPDDTQIKGGPGALFHHGAQCLARAGDCPAAWRAWQENYPSAALAKLTEEQRRESLRSGFRSSIERCADGFEAPEP